MGMAIFSNKKEEAATLHENILKRFPLKRTQVSALSMLDVLQKEERNLIKTLMSCP